MENIKVVDISHMFTDVEFTFLGGNQHGQKIKIPLIEIDCPPDYYDVIDSVVGWQVNTVRYVKRKLISSTGRMLVFYCDSRLSEDEQNALVYAWAKVHLL